MRAKYGIVPVYVLGLYAHPDLRVGADGDALAALRAAASATNEFRLTLVRDVSTSTFVTALEEQVLPRAGKAETDAFSQACRCVRTVFAAGCSPPSSASGSGSPAPTGASRSTGSSIFQLMILPSPPPLSSTSGWSSGIERTHRVRQNEACAYEER